ncbi:TonB-dependent siderophore receptor [Thiobacillus denitrificans ATCC 25259]|uniref:TonB-dependent siderophore receptor n=1 Tax=Thiobacillus denitrificans (strain ATCC 25259 / T1) TaxID=292415 RepID=Q3SKU7_THIDA|nr:TonB-dependent siderophore receptor [Thiobacillus denitrificans]AAZ96675.1 TonB-dependent siderophore receptor [Thiobacillus denitrificans ATCC 25259]
MKKKLLAVLIPLAFSAHAQETEQLEAVSVSADWLGAATPEAAKKHPGARTVVTEQELAESGARTVEDALRTVPGVRVLDESGTGILPNIGVRGLSPLRSEQVLVLVDGMPITLAPYGQTGLSLFPLTLNAVEAIDVARGGVAVHYGPNNVGGVINFVTKRIPRKPAFTAKETLSIASSGNLLSDTYLRAGGFVSERLGLQAQANLIEGEAERDHSSTSVQNLMLDADWFLTDSANLRAGLQYYKTENDMPGALTPASYEADREQSTRPLDRFDGDTLRGHVTYSQAFANGAELSWANFAHRSNRQFFFGNSSNADTPSTNEMSSPREFWVYGSEPRLTFDIDAGVKQKISLGARYLREEVDYVVDSRTLATNAYAVTRDWRFENDAVAAYLSDTFFLLDDRLKVTPGVRHETVDLYYRNNLTGAETRDTTKDWLPGIDIGYQASDAVFLFANYHKSLRPVQFTQITFGGDLDAERAENYEAGIRVAPTANVDTSLTAFRFDFDNKLEFVSQAVGFRNLGEARHQGVEAEVAWRPAAVRGLELKTAYTYVDTEQRSGQFEGNELPLAPHHQLNLQGNYRSGDWNWNLNGLYQSASFSDGANTVDENATGSVGRIPAYSVWNAQVTRDFRWNGTKMKAALALNNLFDRDYYFRGVDFSQGRMPAPGRAALLTLQMDM